MVSPATDGPNSSVEMTSSSSSSQVVDGNTYSSSKGTAAESDIFTHVGTFSISESTSHTLFTDSKPDGPAASVDMQEQDVPLTTTSSSESRPARASPSTVNLADSWVSLSEGTATAQSKYEHEDLAGTGMWEWSCVGLESERRWDPANGAKEGLPSLPDVAGDGGAFVAIVDQWRSCAICLEELSDNELLVHKCSGTFCQSCLDVSGKLFLNKSNLYPDKPFFFFFFFFVRLVVSNPLSR